MSRRFGVTSRVLLAVVLVAATGMAVAGATTLWVQERVLDRRVDASLVQEVDELRLLAAGDPVSGRTYQDVDSVLRAAVQGYVPSENEGVMVMLDGDVPYVSAGVRPLAPEEVPPLREAAAAVGAQDGPVLRTLTSGGQELRFVTVPVTVPGDPALGVFLAAVDVDGERAELRQAAVYPTGPRGRSAREADPAR